MTTAFVRIVRAVLIAGLVTCVLMSSIGTTTGTTIGGISPAINIIVSNAAMLTPNYTTTGSMLVVDATLLADGASPDLRVDVYVGILAPDGETTSLLGNPDVSLNFTPVLVTGPLTPLLANASLTTNRGHRLAIPRFGPAGPNGWHVAYGLIVATGQDPSNPRNWISSSFFPLLVTPPGNP